MKYFRETLPNGLKTITIEDKDSLSATILILVNTGSRFEKQEEAGIAHFVEHTIFKGTENRPDVYKIGMEVESLGAKMNAFTSYDYTGYYIKCPKENFDKAFEILADMFRNSLFRQDDIEKERGVILEELRMYEDQPMDKVQSVFSELVFDGHPLGRDIIGTEESINSLDRKSFKNFTDKFYCAKNTVVSVAGGVDNSEVFKQAEKYFSDLASGDVNKVSERFSSEDFKLEQNTKNLHKSINQTHIVVGGFAPGREDFEKKYPSKVANTILGRGFSSKLFQEIREKQALAYYVYSEIYRFEEIGLAKIAMGVENSKLQIAVDGVSEQMQDMLKGNFSREELNRAKNYMIGGLSLDLESTNQLALWYGIQLLHEEQVREVDEIKDLIRSVNRDRIVSICEEIYNRSGLFLAAVSPHKVLKLSF